MAKSLYQKISNLDKIVIENDDLNNFLYDENEKDEIKFESCKELLKETSIILNSKETPLIEKSKLAKKLIHQIVTNLFLEKYINGIEDNIKNLYYSYYSFLRIIILFDCLNTKELDIEIFEDVLFSYLNFLLQKDNEEFIYYFYTDVVKFKKRIFNFINDRNITEELSPRLLTLIKNNDLLNQIELERKLK